MLSLVDTISATRCYSRVGCCQGVAKETHDSGADGFEHMNIIIWVVFALVYLVMILGELPGLALDRTGVALLGAIILLMTNQMPPSEAWQAVDVPTIALLFGLMVVSAQFRLGGFYAYITRRLAGVQLSPPCVLALLIAVCGLLSAVLANDVVCLAMAPILVEGCARKKLNPVPFLLALACASNVGSAATLIGNPQNMLIGQTLKLSFVGYLMNALVPSVAGLAVIWWIIRWQFRGRWEREFEVPTVDVPPFNPWQSIKALGVTTLLVLAFLLTPWPREVVALAAAGLLLTSRRMASREMLGLVDWQLLVLFISLFIVNHALLASGALDVMTRAITQTGVDPSQAGWLFTLTVVLSNLISNVPAVMLLLKITHHPLAGPILALASTLAGNLFIVGSIANIIVIDQAARLNVRIGWRQHARVGIPVTLATLLIAAAWLLIRFYLR